MTDDELLVMANSIDKAVAPLGYEAITLFRKEDYIVCCIQKRSEEDEE